MISLILTSKISVIASQATAGTIRRPNKVLCFYFLSPMLQMTIDSSLNCWKSLNFSEKSNSIYLRSQHQSLTAFQSQDENCFSFNNIVGVFVLSCIYIYYNKQQFFNLDFTENFLGFLTAIGWVCAHTKLFVKTSDFWH